MLLYRISLRVATSLQGKTEQVTRSDFFRDYDRRFDKLLRFAKFTEMIAAGGEKRGIVVWKKNAMRHSFGSYYFALTGDSLRTSTEMGHRQGDGVLFSYYRALATHKQAQDCFNIVPPVVVVRIGL